MTKKRLFEDIKQNPARIYRSPADVLRDRRFADGERLEILRAWLGSQDNPSITAEIGAILAELEGRLASSHDHAAE